MNAFYCSCHAAENPTAYKNRPTAVAGSPETRHGVVVTASYEARQLGVYTTMTVAEALRQCPQLVLIHPDFALYRRYSKAVFEIVREYTPLVEVFSIDECFADISGSSQFGTPFQIALEIQQRISAELDLPCSIGMAPNKFLAKMASDMKKPLGLTELWQADVPHKLWPLPIGDMFGVGTRSAEKMQSLHIHTIGDLAQTDKQRLYDWFGKRGLQLSARANGQDDSPVNPDPEPLKSVGHSITLAEDTATLDDLERVLLNLSDQVGRRLRRHQLTGRTVTLTLRFANRQTITRADTRSSFTDLTEDIYDSAHQLLLKHWNGHRAIRLVGVTISSLSSETGAVPIERQTSLFTSSEHTEAEMERIQKRSQLTKITDKLRDKYGEDIIVRGKMLESHESNQLRNHRSRGTSLQKDILE
ncbi:DNA polymerase IV [Alicyclobacillus sp. SO9]|nr:DNA polymerase IV [Alicyclobacillus sp. SO9]